MTRKLTLTAMFLFGFLALGVVTSVGYNAVISDAFAFSGK